MRNIHWQPVEAYTTLIKSATEFSVERSLGTVFHVAGTISKDGHDMFTRTHHMAEHLLNTALGHEEKALTLFAEWKYEHEELMGLLESMRNYILNNRETKQNLLTGITWYRRSDYYVKTIYWLSEEVLQKVRKKIDNDVSSYNKIIGANCVIILFTGSFLIPLLIQMAKKTSKTLTGYTHVMEKKSLEVRREKRKTENILNQMLPRAVSQK